MKIKITIVFLLGMACAKVITALIQDFVGQTIWTNLVVNYWVTMPWIIWVPILIMIVMMFIVIRKSVK